MDDTQQTAQPTDVNTDVAMPSSMSDVAAGMTPPPAPVMPEPDSMPMAAAPEPSVAMSASSGEEDYASAEDVLNEILDSLDRIEAKLEAMEKKMG